MERNKRILVVDDQSDLREQLAKLLKRSGKKNETVSLVQQMREKLLGHKKDDDEEEEDIPSEEGYVIDTVGQGQDAFEKVKEKNAENEPYALMFLDMRMPPGWDGLETAKRIREVDKDIEIVIMTAYADHDHRKIADTVGTPEKLLYIKKPFQAEEIHQLALSLTTKWTLEKTEKLRKEWLETLIRCMSKIKSVASVDQKNTYENTLKAVFDFTKASKGFITIKNEKEQKWNIGAFIDVDEKEVQAFVEENVKRLDESRTTQSVEGKYFLPLKKEGYSAIVILYDLKTHGDPEWYKLLSLLVMTASEILSNASLISEILKKNGGNDIKN